MPHAAAYLRRSSADDENPGVDSRGRQLAAVQRMCGADVAIYEDWGISGSAAKTEKRTEYARLKADIVAGRVSSVCAESLSRLGRSTRELLAFVDLCKDHGVQVQTEKEHIDTTGAMGRFMFTLMASVGELELEMGKERSAGSRLARLARHQAADALLPGGKLPNGVAAYGFVNVTTDGITRREHDPEHPMAPLVQAFNDAGQSVRGACELLQRRGIPSPKGSKVWGSSTLSRILTSHTAPGCDHGLALPDRNASGRSRREKAGRPALFAGLLLCHCGRTMTPNVARGQYYCAGGRDSGSAQHGKYSTTEAALKAALWPQVARQYRAGPKPIFRERDERGILDLQARRERVAAAMLDGLITPAKAKAETSAIDAKLDKLQRRAGAWTGMFAGDTVLDLNGDPAEQNALLRRLWLRVDMDATMAPHVVWVIDPDVARAQEDA